MPRPPGPGPVAVAALLLVGVAAASLGFARSRSTQTPGGERAQPPGAASDAARAPEAVAPFLLRKQELEERLAREPADRDALLELARLLHDGHRAAAAVPLYRRALALSPADAQVVYDLAAAHGETGEWEEAAEVLLARLGSEPGDAVALYDLGAVRANQGRVEEARRQFQEALRRATDGALRARISEALARLGEVDP